MEKRRVLIVDDDDELRTQMKWALNSHYEVILADDRASALEVVKKDKPGVVTHDLGLPPSPGDTREGFLALSEMLQCNPALKVLVITGQSERENGLEAIGQGAYDFLPKPVNVDELKIIIDRAVHVEQLDRERRALIENSTFASFEDLLGSSPQMQ